MGTRNAAGRQIEQRAGEAHAGTPFFEVSKIVPSPDMLKDWVEWFRKLNIPCAVMKTRKGYVLWRKGTEVGRPRSKNPSELVVKNIVYSYGI